MFIVITILEYIKTIHIFTNEIQVSSISKQDTVDTDLPKYLAEAADSIGNAIRYESEENWEQVS